MIDRRQCRIDSVDRHHGGSGRTRDNDHLDAEAARSLDLGISSRTAAVLGDDDVDAVLLEQGDFAFEIEGTAIQNVMDIWNSDPRHDRIDATHEIEMLRRRLGATGLLPAGRKQDAAGRGTQSGNRLGNACRGSPQVARLLRPFGPSQREDGNVSCAGRFDCVGGYTGGEGVGCADQQIKFPLDQKTSEAFGTAETADAHRNRLSRRFFRAAGKREQNVVSALWRKGLRELSRLGGSPEDQNADFSHV